MLQLGRFLLHAAHALLHRRRLRAQRRELRGAGSDPPAAAAAAAAPIPLSWPGAPAASPRRAHLEETERRFGSLPPPPPPTPSKTRPASRVIVSRAGRETHGCGRRGTARRGSSGPPRLSHGRESPAAPGTGAALRGSCAAPHAPAMGCAELPPAALSRPLPPSARLPAHPPAARGPLSHVAPVPPHLFVPPATAAAEFLGAEKRFSQYSVFEMGSARS